jgi:glycosyltransferase involved in cell wall biosynthesis
MEKLNCLLVHNYELESGGISILNDKLAKYLSKNGWQVTIFTPLGENSNNGSYYVESNEKRLVELIKNSDVVILSISPFLHQLTLKTISYLQFFQKEFLVWFHVVLDENIYQKRYQDFEKRKEKLREIFNNHLCRKIICVSQNVKEKIEFLVSDKNKLEVIYPFIEDFDSKTRKKRILRDLVYVGRLSDEKNIEVLIKALSLLIKKRKKIFLSIVGDGPEKEKIKDLVKQLNLEKYVKFFGHLSRNEVINLIKNHKFLVLPSKIESFGLVILEAIFNDVPVIVSNTYGPKEIFSSIDYKLFFNYDDYKNLAQKIEYGLKNYQLFKKNIRLIKKKLKTRFNSEKQLKKFENLLLNVLLYKEVSFIDFKNIFYQRSYYCFLNN